MAIDEMFVQFKQNLTGMIIKRVTLARYSDISFHAKLKNTAQLKSHAAKWELAA
jgi:hypothetical protein